MFHIHLPRHRTPAFRSYGELKRHSGLTILELMVILAIISIMAIIALPELGRMISRGNLSRQAEQMTTILGRVRDLAMDQGFTWRILFSPDQGSWICFCDRDDDSRQDPGEQKLGPFLLERGVLFGCQAERGPNNTEIPEDGVCIDRKCMSFSSMGCCNGGTIYIQDRESSMAVRVLSASGVVRIWQYKNSWEVIK